MSHYDDYVNIDAGTAENPASLSVSKDDANKKKRSQGSDIQSVASEFLSQFSNFLCR